MQNILKKNEVLADLCLDGLKIIQNTQLYRFTSDAVVLANFVFAKPKDRVLDIGAGTGIIAILATHKNNLQNVVGVEIQSDVADMATRSVQINNLAEKIKIIKSDIKTFVANNQSESFDVVVCNPPYKKAGVGKVNLNESQAISRHEIKITLAEICTAAKKLLRFGGKFFVCNDAARTAELLTMLTQNNLQPKKIFFTQSSASSNAKIVFVMAVKGGKSGTIVLPTLITNNDDGTYLESVRKMRF